MDENVHTPVFMKDVEEARVIESAPPNTLVGTFSAVDGDSNPADAFVTYSLVGPEGRGVFYIDQSGKCDLFFCFLDLFTVAAPQKAFYLFVSLSVSISCTAETL